MTLKGKVALVTGARGRLGPVWIEALEAAGADKVWGIDQEEYDLRDPVACQHVVEAFGDVDILVNNAGVDSRPGGVVRAGRAMLDVNIAATDALTAGIGAAMASWGEGGCIINVASLYGLVAPDLRYYDHRADGWQKDALYGASKAAIISLTQYYAAKFGPAGVRVNALAPGGVVADGDGLTAQDPQFAAKYTARIPMGRMCRPADLAGPLVFLASEMSSFITGVTIPIDGGFLCL